MKRIVSSLCLFSLALVITAFGYSQSPTANCCQKAAACCQKGAACCDKSTCCDKAQKPACCDKASCCDKSPAQQK